MQWTKRPATVDDGEFACTLHRAAYQAVVIKQFGQWDEVRQQQFFEDKWRPEAYEIVEIQGRPIGVLCVTKTQYEVRIVEIQLLPEYQGRGIGTELLQRELQLADEQGLPVRLQVLLKNQARALYQRLGFRVYDKTDTHVLMERACPL